MTETLATEGGSMKTLEEIALQIGKEVFGAVDECLSGQGERDREVTSGEYPIGEGCIDFARRLVAALGAQEPVGFVYEKTLSAILKSKEACIRDTQIQNGSPLYAAPVVNEGWQMVPKEPTVKMFQSAESAGFHTYTGTWTIDPFVCYKAMLAAAPEYKP